MPRELYLVTSAPVDIESLVRAAADVDANLLLRGLYGGAALQMVGDEDRAVLTVENSRLLADGFDARRVTRGLELPDGEIWWTEATAPWGSVGDPGVAVLQRLAQAMDGQLRVEDGT